MPNGAVRLGHRLALRRQFENTPQSFTLAFQTRLPVIISPGQKVRCARVGAGPRIALFFLRILI
jgi:hypothetical protein